MEDQLTKKDLITIREWTDSDKQFILTTWLKGFYFGNRLPRDIDEADTSNRHWMQYWMEDLELDNYKLHYRKVIDHILSKPNIKITVSCLLEDPGTILGYSVTEDKILHWVFVRQDWRKIGLSKDMMPSGINTVTHLTKSGLKLKRKLNLMFDPWKI